MLWYHISGVTQILGKNLVQANNKELVKTQHCWPSLMRKPLVKSYPCHEVIKLIYILPLILKYVASGCQSQQPVITAEINYLHLFYLQVINTCHNLENVYLKFNFNGNLAKLGYNELTMVMPMKIHPTILLATYLPMALLHLIPLWMSY